MITNIFDQAVRAIEEGQQTKLTKLVKSSPQLILQQHPDSQYTLLHYAAKYNRSKIAEQLINLGIPLELYPRNSYMPDHKGAGSGTWTALCQALNVQSMEVAELIASHKVTPNNLWVAVGLGRWDLVLSFFSQDGTLKDNAGDPGKLQSKQDILNDCFAMACHTGRVDLINFLLDKGADINGIDHWGMTGLHWAIQCHPELSRYLIEQGADVRIRDAQHVATQLSWALHFGNNQLADYMIENCSIDIVDAINLGKENIVRKILTGDPELVDGQLGLGEPLRMAAKRGNEAIIEILLSSGANPKIYDVKTGMFDQPELKLTALQWAKKNSYFKIAQKLQQAGAEK